MGSFPVLPHSHVGIFDIGDGMNLVVQLGTHQSLKLTQGDSLGDTSIVMIMEDESPLFNYPFDKVGYFPDSVAVILFEGAPRPAG